MCPSKQSTSRQEVRNVVCHQHGHQLTSYNGDNELICRACGSTFTQIRDEPLDKPESK